MSVSEKSATFVQNSAYRTMRIKEITINNFHCYQRTSFQLADSVIRSIRWHPYTSKGELDYDDTVYDSRWFDRKHLNLTNAWITLVRRIWYKVAKSTYSDMDVEKARTDKELRQNIIDDIDSNNEIACWNESDPAWNLFAKYNWFYGYYTSSL